MNQVAFLIWVLKYALKFQFLKFNEKLWKHFTLNLFPKFFQYNFAA